jgi:hypothetical protein
LIADSDRIERQFLDGVGRSFAMVDSIRPAHPMSAIRSSRGPAAAGISCLLVLGSAFSTRAAAEAWLVQPTVAFSTQYEDNIRLDSDEQDAAWTNIPTLQALVSRQTETLDVRALGRFRYRAYESSADLEDSGQELARLGSEYRTERSVFGLDASWRSQDSLADRGNFDSDLPGDIDDSDADSRLLQVQVTRNRGDIVPSYAFQWSERTQIGAELAYQTQNYDDAGTTIQLTEYEQYRLALNHRYRLDERTMWTNTLRATDYEANKAERTYDTNEILTGVSRAFTERVRLGFQVGWRKTEFDTPADQGSNNGYTIQLTGALRDELSELSGRLSHQLVPSSSGDVVEQDEAVLEYRYKMTPRLDLGVRARYFENASLVLDNPRNNRRYLYVEPELDYALSLAWSLRATLFHEREDRETFDSEATNSGVMFSVVFTPPSELD